VARGIPFQGGPTETGTARQTEQRPDTLTGKAAAHVYVQLSWATTTDDKQIHGFSREKHEILHAVGPRNRKFGGFSIRRSRFDRASRETALFHAVTVTLQQEAAANREDVPPRPSPR